MTSHRLIGRRGQLFLERLPLAADRPAIGYGVALLLVGIAFAVRYEVGDSLPPGFPFLTFFPAVIGSAFLFGLRPGVLAAVLSGLLAWYFFIAPFASFALTGGSALAMGFYALIVAVDIALIHWMQVANERLSIERRISRDLAANRELLFQELQHRVSNNLQVVAALLALQKRDVGDADARHALDEAARRLGLVGRIHRQLYDPTGGRLGMAAFLEQLCGDVIEAGGKPGIRCSVTADAAIEIEPDAAIPVALIVAEAVSNALEHGFAGLETGEVRVALARGEESGILLSIADDGHGLPPHFDLAKADSLGLRIASTLARQLGGDFTLSSAGGTLARLTLPG